MRKLGRFSSWLCGAALILVLVASPARATIFTGTDGAGHTASADFELSGTTLTITLTNQGTAKQVTLDVLHAIFFNVTGGPTLTQGTANLTAGSTLINYDGTDHEFDPQMLATAGATSRVRPSRRRPASPTRFRPRATRSAAFG